MRNFKYIWAIGLGITFLIIAMPIIIFAGQETEMSADPWDSVPVRVPHTNHANLITGEFESGSDVTKACLECHEDAAHEVAQTVHWTWESEPVSVSGHDELVTIGKKNQINNFCIGIEGNWTGCTRCHAGYGWDSADFDFEEETNIDCLVCHDQSGLYVKGNSGLPVEAVDLTAVAQSVGTPSRNNCGGCHFNGGGGNAVKHGDLDSSLFYPSEDVDVHMGRYNFQCVDCHRTENHNIGGHMISVSVTGENAIACTDCHESNLHSDERITAHLDSVACQTCHIPAGAIRDATKMQWDWSQAGDDTREESQHEYLKIKGAFVYENDFQPSYAWFNGNADRYIVGDVIDPTVNTVLNQPEGDINDADARIWPFKIHHTLQPYDINYNYLLIPKTVGEGGYWTDFDWDQAFYLNEENAGLEYSGEHGFAPTTMYWTQTHLVQPKDNALQCTDCHSDNGRMDWEALGYYGDPMRWGNRSQTIGVTKTQE